MDSWTRLGEVNDSIVRRLDGRDGFFQYNNEGYIIPFRFSDLEEFKMLKLDPGYKGFLKEEEDFPLGYRNGRLFSFIINDILYIGGDDYETEDQKPDFWKYDFGTKEWIQIESFSGGERSFVNSFSYDGAGFAMFGLNSICCVSSNAKIEPGIWTYGPAVK